MPADYRLILICQMMRIKTGDSLPVKHTEELQQFLGNTHTLLDY